MRSDKKTPQKPLSALEHTVMEFLWAHGASTAEQIRAGLAASHPMKDATVRTLLRRLEEKGYAAHTVDGRTFIYSGLERRAHVAVNAVRQIIDSFCGGSVEELMLGLVDQDVLSPDELRELARKIDSRKRSTPSK
jgi:predicted transcriptional regulator